MSKYEHQKYFEELCKMYCIAYRASKMAKDDVAERIIWNNRKKSLMYTIQQVIDNAFKEGETYIITTFEEIFVLIKYYENPENDSWPIINTSDEAILSFPTGRIAKEFFKAYMVADYEAIVNLSKFLDKK